MRGLIKTHFKTIFTVRLVLLMLMWAPTVHGEKPIDCSKQTNVCEYYTCLESQKSCGRFGYPTGFGKKYCLRFEKKEHKFTEAGKLWVEKTRECLIDKLDELDEDVSCKKLKKSAFKQHVACYVDSGYCDLKKKDRRALVSTIRPSLWRGKVIRAGLKVKKICRKLRRE